MYGEIITLGEVLMITAFSMTAVMVILLFISYFIQLLAILTRTKEKPASVAVGNSPAAQEAEQPAEDTALPAVISAAIACYLQQDINTFVVRSVKAVNNQEPIWAKMGRIEMMNGEKK